MAQHSRPPADCLSRRSADTKLLKTALSKVKQPYNTRPLRCVHYHFHYILNLYDLQLHEEIRAAEERVTIAATQASVTTEDLANARRELHDLREAMFSSIAESDGPDPDDAGAPPPPFTPGDTPSLFSSPVHTPPAGPPPAWPTPSLNQSSPFSPPTGAPPGWPTPVASRGFPSAPPAANQPLPFSPGPVNQTSPFSPVATHPASPFSPPHGPPPGWQGPIPSLATSPPASGSSAPRPAGPAGWSSCASMAFVRWDALNGSNLSPSEPVRCAACIESKYRRKQTLICTVHHLYPSDALVQPWAQLAEGSVEHSELPWS
jgi:hypothetical protein